ncbi:MAG TPA: isocitrate/isopropylmalate family dehydrogenase [Kofleriaceae bacterium]|nr:isocitrate/isopropylmalate family dehydrogenase [Kofleriaceae bacterium]
MAALANPDPSMWVLPGGRRAEDAHVVAVGGDGIGPEVVAAAIECLAAVAPGLRVVQPVQGAEAVERHGSAFPEPLKAELARADAVLFGAVDTERGQARPILSYLRWERESYANLRPTATLPGVPALTGPRGCNLVIVRELTEGLYPGREGELAALNGAWPAYRDRMGRQLPPAGAFALRVVTETASRRIGAYAARLAAHRKSLGISPGKVTVVTKQNVLPQTDGLFRGACEAEAAAVGGLEVDHLYVDEAARRMVAQLESFDVVVTTNLFGDVLSDVAAEGMGGLPLAPSAGIGDGWAYFESCHGSAPDLAGKDVANPAATILSAAMMLTYLGLPDPARRLVGATISTIAAGVRTRDLGGQSGTRAFAAEVCRRL